MDDDKEWYKTLLMDVFLNKDYIDEPYNHCTLQSKFYKKIEEVNLNSCWDKKGFVVLYFDITHGDDVELYFYITILPNTLYRLFPEKILIS